MDSLIIAIKESMHCTPRQTRDYRQGG